MASRTTFSSAAPSSVMSSALVPAGALRAAADDQMLGAKFRRGARRPFDPGQFLAEDVVEDEVAA